MLISNVSAQFNGDGFYRVQNYGTKRYLYITDYTGSYDMKRDIGDFGAIHLLQGHEKTISDPSSILYLKEFGSQIDIQGQGISIYQIVKRYVDLKSISTPPFAGTYTVGATESGITKYLDDEEINVDIPDGVVGTNRGSPYRNWLIHPVSSSSDNYFGITPLFSINGKYYYPLYAAFPYKAASPGIKIYTVSKYDLELGYAVLSEITGVVPSRTPVLIECSSSSPSDNRLDLVASEETPPSNAMEGVLFSNYERRNKSTYAITAYNEERMRVLGKTSEGKLGFVKSTEYLRQIEGSYYLPANISYMFLPAGSPSELTVISAAEYDEILSNRTFTITYIIDGEVYKTEQVKVGQPINADNPTREGYTFNGWSGLPDTMPDHDITITGSFTGINYNITYILEGNVYKVVAVPCGTVITPLEVTKEGYFFVGWDGLPEAMPAHDITVSGYFTIGTYKLIYTIDGVEYQIQTYTYGDAVTPLGNPSRDGYIFSGWSAIPTSMPGHDVVITGSYTPLVYTIRYMIDGKLYEEQNVPCGQTISAPTVPEKEGYHFKEWEGLPSVMTAGDLTVTAVYEPNIYNVVYVVDGETYKIVGVAYGTVITPIDYPVKEGYKFSGWSQMPGTMPANDITVSGTFSLGTYKLQYVINGAGYKNYVYFSREYKFGQSVTPYNRTPSAITGYTFSGWGEVPATMPGHDVNVYGTYKANDYTITYMVDGVLYQKVTVSCGDPIPELTPIKTGYTFKGWKNLPATMPANDITVSAQFSINSYVVKYVLVIGEKGGTQLFRSSRYTYGADLSAITSAPSRMGYTFMGWEKMPATMPASNVTVLGRYKANSYQVKYYVADKMVHQQEVAYDDSIPAFTYRADGIEIADSEWQGTRYSTMPAKDVVYTCSQDIIDRLSALPTEKEEDDRMLFDLSGRRISAMKGKGVYIVNGKKILKQ